MIKIFQPEVKSNSLGSSHNGDKVRAKKRIKSLDTFRGITIAFMIFVNYGGGEYWFFEHASWYGLTFADLLFPWFVFMGGVSVELSFNSKLRRGESKWNIAYELYRRCLRLYAIGLIINGNHDLETFRIPGVLQRFAWAFFVNGSLMLILYNKPMNQRIVLKDQSNKIKFYLQEWLADSSYVIFNIVILLLVMLFQVITLAVPYDNYNCPAGYYGPGGIQTHKGHSLDLFVVGKNNIEELPYHNCTGGIARHIDQQILGTNHIYQWPTCIDTYFPASIFPEAHDNGVPFDPEGILGNFGSIFMVALGIWFCRVYNHWQEDKQRIMRWSGYGVILIILGLIFEILNDFNNLVFAHNIIKNLWSLTFVLYLAGAAYIILAILYFVQDMKNLWFGRPFFYMGRNSMLLYCLHCAWGEMSWPFDSDSCSSHMCALFTNLLSVFIFAVLSLWCYVIDYYLVV